MDRRVWQGGRRGGGGGDSAGVEDGTGTWCDGQRSKVVTGAGRTGSDMDVVLQEHTGSSIVSGGWLLLLYQRGRQRPAQVRDATRIEANRPGGEAWA